MVDSANILVVEDDPIVWELLRELLTDHGFNPIHADSAEAGLQKLELHAIELVLSDKNLPGMSGVQMMPKIKAVDPELDVIIMTAYADMQSVLAALEHGVYDYLVKPFESLDDVIRKLERAIEKRRIRLENIRLVKHLTVANAQIEEMNRGLEQKVRERTRQLYEANQRLQELTLTDDVTGLYNQRFLYQRLEEEFARQRRYKEGLAVIMMDLDEFKRVNDSRDHLFGSRVLRRVARLIQDKIRNTDYAIRYGGDEFTVILPHTTLDQASLVAERIRGAVEKADMADPVGGAAADLSPMAERGEVEIAEYNEPFFVTASLGIACLGECSADSPKSLLRASDRALYAAKAQGRNQVCLMKGETAVKQVAI